MSSLIWIVVGVIVLIIALCVIVGIIVTAISASIAGLVALLHKNKTSAAAGTGTATGGTPPAATPPARTAVPGATIAQKIKKWAAWIVGAIGTLIATVVATSAGILVLVVVCYFFWWLFATPSNPQPTTQPVTITLTYENTTSNIVYLDVGKDATGATVRYAASPGQIIKVPVVIPAGQDQVAVAAENEAGTKLMTIMVDKQSLSFVMLPETPATPKAPVGPEAPAKATQSTFARQPGSLAPILPESLSGKGEAVVVTLKPCQECDITLTELANGAIIGHYRFHCSETGKVAMCVKQNPASKDDWYEFRPEMGTNLLPDINENIVRVLNTGSKDVTFTYWLELRHDQ